MPERFGLRRLNEADIQTFVDWERKERPYPWSYEHFRETLDSKTTETLILEKSGAPLGFVVVQIIYEEAYLLNLMISPIERQLDHGTDLLDKAILWLKDSGIKQVFLDVDPNNRPAVGLYKKIGFQIIEKRPRSYPRGEDSILMGKNLA